jgi:hypothetical protein
VEPGRGVEVGKGVGLATAAAVGTGLENGIGLAALVAFPGGFTLGLAIPGALGATVAPGAGFDSSFSKRPTRLSALCLAVKIVNKRVTPKKIPPRYTVAFVRTVVVCAPKMFSVIPDPKAAPSPSLRGLCINTTRVSNTHTITRIVSRIGIRIDSHIERAPICVGFWRL